MSPRAAVTTLSLPQAVPLYAQPSDVTLVKDILQPWVTSGDTNAGAYVHAADLYYADPEALARRFRPAVSVDGDFTWYFLSPLRTKSPRDRRKVRAVADGTGCWHSEAAPKNVVDHLDGGRHVGYRQSFSFMRRGGGGEDVRAGWIMAEFHLHHEGLGMKVEGLVLCKMYRSPRKHDAAVAPKHGPAVALKHGAAVAPNGDDDVCSGVSLSTETTISCGMSKAVNDDAVTPRWQGKNSDGVDMAIAMTTAPLHLTKKAAGDDEVSGMTTAMAPCPNDKALAADDEDSLVSPPARKKMRVAVADGESSGAVMAVADGESSGVVMARKAMAAGDTAAEAQLHCPQCGFHLAALQALVTLTKSKLIVPHGDAADAEITRR